MHHFVRAADIKPTTAFPSHSTGYRRFALSTRDVGAVHSGWGLCELDAGGHLDLHMQSFEKSFYVLAGHPIRVGGLPGLDDEERLELVERPTLAGVMVAAGPGTESTS